MLHPAPAHVLSSVAVVALLMIAGCGSPPSAEAPAAISPAAPEANNGEAPSVTYVDARYRYRIDGPGHMAANADGTASVIGPSERLIVAVVQGSSAADPAGLARKDVGAMPSTTAGFRLLSGPSAVNINGKTVQKLVFAYNAGTSTVTGKPLDLIGVRYYISKDSTTLAVVTYGIVSNQYDPQGADDIASTFQWQ